MADLASKLLDWLDLPQGAVMGWPGIVMEGNRRLRFENHKGIREYGGERLRIESDLGVLCIEGKGLELRTLRRNWVLVEGVIELVRFEHRDGTAGGGEGA